MLKLPLPGAALISCEQTVVPVLLNEPWSPAGPNLSLQSDIFWQAGLNYIIL